MIKIDEVVEMTLVAIYSKDVLNENLYLKGGQALRIAQNMRSRFSGDADFSTKKGFNENDPFFGHLRDSLYNEFLANDLYLFDFNYVRKPKIKKEGAPDFWGGWQVEFKLIEKEKMTQKLEDQRRQALIPEGAESPKIKLDISEYEYCESIETVKVKSVKVKVYTRVLLVLEKIRAICQQHPEYQLKGISSNRARDYI